MLLHFVQVPTVVLLQIITHIFLWPVKLMFRHFAGNVCTTNLSSAIPCGLSWHRPGEKCICTGCVSGEVAKGGTNTCAPGVGTVAGNVPRSANISSSGLMIPFFLLFAMRSSMQYLRRSLCDLGRKLKQRQGRNLYFEPKFASAKWRSTELNSLCGSYAQYISYPL